jgi:hypothetical protein
MNRPQRGRGTPALSRRGGGQREETDAERSLKAILREGLRARVRSVGVADILILNGGDLYEGYEEP